MSYFTPAFTAFFRGLGRRNTRPWFHAHRTEFETAVKQPFADFVAEMIERIATLDPGMRCEPREAIFRIARDTRFSRDKTPYKVHASAVIGPDGRKTEKPAFYFELSARGLGVAGGVYQPDRASLHRIREAIRDGGDRLERLLRDRTFRRLCGTLQGERNVRLPPEFAPAAGRHPLLYHKQFYWWAEIARPATVRRSDLAEFLMRYYRAGRPVNAWLGEALTRT
jgi:uncharacterized protein (TIGR02453 family)